MVVEVKGLPLSEGAQREKGIAQLEEAMRRSRASYGLLFSPDRSVLVGPDAKRVVFDGSLILDLYGIRELPKLEPGSLAETAVYTWLVDLSLGISRPSPEGFPSILGDEIRRAA